MICANEGSGKLMSKIKLINALLILAIFPTLAFFAKDYLALKYRPQKTAPPKAAIADIPVEPKMEDYALIVEGRLFPSRADRLTPIEVVEAGPASAGVLSELKLIGTFDGGEGFAVFEKAGANQQAFKKGETVFDSGVLKDVSAESAVIRSGARDVTFTLEIERPEGVKTAPPEPERPKSGGNGKGLSKKLSESAWVIDQNAVLSSLEDMGSILTDARMTPRVAKGSIQGFTVTEIKPRGVFDAIGLKNGDVLTRINGYDIDSPERAMQVLAGLRGATAIDLDLIRGGEKKSFHYDIR